LKDTRISSPKREKERSGGRAARRGAQSAHHPRKGEGKERSEQKQTESRVKTKKKGKIGSKDWSELLWGKSPREEIEENQTSSGGGGEGETGETKPRTKEAFLGVGRVDYGVVVWVGGQERRAWDGTRLLTVPPYRQLFKSA